MNVKEILNHIKGKDVIIIGPPASGKTYLATLLTSPNHTVLHTDDYMDHGYKESLYALLNDLKHVDGNVIVEGVQGYRLLRKGVELSCYYPQVVIELQISQERMEKTYREQRPGKDFSYVKSFNKMHAKIKSDYLAMENPSKPQWITIQNDY